MAKLRVSDEALLQALFPDQIGLTLDGVKFDPERRLLVLELRGLCIPDADEIVAEITVQRRATHFRPAHHA